ncbi:hypothetical protein ACOME3_007508 [Neoechinorhynchus agilis]
MTKEAEKKKQMFNFSQKHAYLLTEDSSPYSDALNELAELARVILGDGIEPILLVGRNLNIMNALYEKLELIIQREFELEREEHELRKSIQVRKDVKQRLKRIHCKIEKKLKEEGTSVNDRTAPDIIDKLTNQLNALEAKIDQMANDLTQKCEDQSYVKLKKSYEEFQTLLQNNDETKKIFEGFKPKGSSDAFSATFADF